MSRRRRSEAVLVYQCTLHPSKKRVVSVEDCQRCDRIAGYGFQEYKSCGFRDLKKTGDGGS